MTRIASFIDGFTSASAPIVSGGSQENFDIENSIAVAETLFTIDGDEYKSAFGTLELERSETGSEFRQVVSFLMAYDGTDWAITFGAYQGDDLIQDTLVNDEHITLSMTTASGVGSVKYTSGVMDAVYSGNLKMFITRIVVA